MVYKRVKATRQSFLWWLLFLCINAPLINALRVFVILRRVDQIASHDNMFCLRADTDRFIQFVSGFSDFTYAALAVSVFAFPLILAWWWRRYGGRSWVVPTLFYAIGWGVYLWLIQPSVNRCLVTDW